MKNRIFLSFIFLLSLFSFVKAQDMSKLTPLQLMELNKKMGSGNENSNLMNGSSGMSQLQQLQLLRQMNKGNQDGLELEDEYGVRMYLSEDSVELFEEFLDNKKLRIYGSGFFNNKKITFEPNLNLATPVNYVIGAGDQLLVDISGLYDASYKLNVSPDGKIRIPNAGPVKVGGVTIESATRIIKNELAKYYSGLSSGETRVNVNLGNIRSIKVTIVGEAQRPGTYTLPSLASVFNALYACGGPSEIGSLRKINIFRNGGRVATMDFYEFLKNGKSENNIVLQDNDMIMIEANNNKVIVDGAINRRAIYEIVPGESLQDLFNYAGGFAENANQSIVSVFRIDGNQRKVIDIPFEFLSTSLVKSGDSIFIAEVAAKVSNEVVLQGAVYRPGSYAADADLTVSKLITKAGGVTDYAFINMANIKRQRKNQIPEIIGFNLGKILSGDNKDIQLMRNDTLTVDSVKNYMEDQSVRIAGEVLDPDTYPLDRKLTVKDLIYLAKGFTENASTENIQLVRIIKDPSKMENGNKKSYTINFSFDKNLNILDGQGDMALENGDLVIVRPIEGIEPIRMAAIQGEVKFPGYYNIDNKNLRISEFLKLSGGFTNFAFLKGAYLIRKEKQNDSKESSMDKILSRNLKKILQSSSNNQLDANMIERMQVNKPEDLAALDSLASLGNVKEIEKLLNMEGVVSLRLDQILRRPGNMDDILVEDGDIIFIPKKKQTVKVIGEVMYPSYIVHSNNMRFTDFITGSGGFSDDANKKNVFVLLPNGKVIGTKSFLGFRVFPRVEAGSTIIVPKKSIDLTPKLSAAEIISMSTSVSSAMVLIYSILNK